MAEPKTKLRTASVKKFLDAIKDGQMRKDCRTVAAVMRNATKSKPRMWGAGIVGFGTYTMTYANGKEGTWMLLALAPREKHFTLYVAPKFPQRGALMAKLGKYRSGKSCIHVKRLSDLQLPILVKLVNTSV